MKPKKAKKQIQSVFDKFLKKELTPLQTVKELPLEALLRMKKEYRNDGDPRTGSETYGFDSWSEDLYYISDRWQCQFRVQWLIELKYLKDQDEI